MELKPLTEPKVGTTVFNGHLMATITKVQDKDVFEFVLINGNYGGHYRHGQMYIMGTRQTHPVELFQEVVYMTMDEQRKWHLK
jgi:hypothetical protein